MHISHLFWAFMILNLCSCMVFSKLLKLGWGYTDWSFEHFPFEPAPMDASCFLFKQGILPIPADDAPSYFSPVMKELVYGTDCFEREIATDQYYCKFRLLTPIGEFKAKLMAKRASPSDRYRKCQRIARSACIHKFNDKPDLSPIFCIHSYRLFNFFHCTHNSQ